MEQPEFETLFFFNRQHHYHSTNPYYLHVLSRPNKVIAVDYTAF